MTRQPGAAPVTPSDMTKDQVTETRRVLQEMNDANRAIDDQVARSTLMTPKR